MVKVTNDVLAEKIDGLDNKIELYHADLKELRTECKINTEFRNKAVGVWTVICAIGGFVGGFALWLLSKVWK